MGTLGGRWDLVETLAPNVSTVKLLVFCVGYEAVETLGTFSPFPALLSVSSRALSLLYLYPGSLLVFFARELLLKRLQRPHVSTVAVIC